MTDRILDNKLPHRMGEKSLLTVHLIEEYCIEDKRSQRTKHSNPDHLIAKWDNKLNR